MALIPLGETLKDMFKSLRKGFIYTPKLSRRASRAGLLHFPKVSLLSGYQIPKISPARFARRIASFSEVFLLSGHQIPHFPRRASRAGLLDVPKASLLSGHQIPQIANFQCISYTYIIPSKGQKPAQFGAPDGFVCYFRAALRAANSLIFSGALRAPECIISLCLLVPSGPRISQAKAKAKGKAKVHNPMPTFLVPGFLYSNYSAPHWAPE